MDLHAKSKKTVQELGGFHCCCCQDYAFRCRRGQDCMSGQGQPSLELVRTEGGTHPCADLLKKLLWKVCEARVTQVHKKWISTSIIQGRIVETILLWLERKVHLQVAWEWLRRIIRLSLRGDIKVKPGLFGWFYLLPQKIQHWAGNWSELREDMRAELGKDSWYWLRAGRGSLWWLGEVW